MSGTVFPPPVSPHFSLSCLLPCDQLEAKLELPHQLPPLRTLPASSEQPSKQRLRQESLGSSGLGMPPTGLLLEIWGSLYLQTT